jgi:hypothetical protein
VQTHTSQPLLVFCHPFIRLAIARNMTSCIFIARSQAASVLRFWHVDHLAAQSGPFMC